MTGEVTMGATAEKGRATADHQVAGFIDLLRKVAEMPLPEAPATL